MRVVELDAAGDISDETLLTRTCDGDEIAFATLVHRYEQPLFRYACRLLGSRTEAEDVFQETFLRVYTHRQELDPRRPLRPWIYRVATNLCRDRLRFRWRRPTISLDDTTESLHAAGSDPVAGMIAREKMERLERALAALPVKHRAVVLMARYESMSYDEISRVLGVPLGTVKSRMNKAVAELLRRMKSD